MTSEAPGDRLDTLRERLERAGDLPLAQRAELLEDVHRVVVEELAAMEEV